MERLLEDALNVRNLLPWIESDEDIIYFMRKIPLDKSHLRIQLTLRYFLKKRDSYRDDFEKKIKDDAKEIVIVLPGTSYKEIRERLSVLGCMPDRKEVVLRQLLHEKSDLDRIVAEIDFSGNKKRKSEEADIFDLNSRGSETNIKIKIRKREGSLEVVSTIKQEKASPSKAAFSTAPDLNELTSPSITSSTSISETSTPDSTVPSSSSVINNDPCPEFTSILNNLIASNQPSTSGGVMSGQDKKRSTVPSLNSNNKVCTNVSNDENLMDTIENNSNPNEANIPSVITQTSKNNANNHVAIEEQFNLVKFIKEMTLASEKKILQICKKLNLNVNVRPHGEMLNYVLNQLFDNVIEVDSNEEETNSSDSSETEEYTIPDDSFQLFEEHYNLENTSNKMQGAPANSVLNPNVKEFKLKEPVLTFAKTTSSNDYTLPKPKILPRSTSTIPVIKPPRFTLPDDRAHAEPNTIPAMPQTFLDKLRSSAPPTAEEPLPQTSMLPVDLTVPENNKLPPLENMDFAEAGPSVVHTQKKRVVDEILVLRLIEMFPEACPDYIRNVCDGKKWADFDDVVTVILSAEDYPKRPQRPPSPEVDPEEQFEILKELLPDADPDYLRMHCEKYANDDKGLKEFINQAMELKNYPTLKEYLRKQKLSAQQKQYTTEFSIENFIELFPDPAKSFNDPKRTVKIDAFESHYLIIFFRNKYDRISLRIIQQVLHDNKYKVIPSNKQFLSIINNNQVMKSRRRPAPLPDNLQNIPLLQELAYINHEVEIENYLKEKRIQEEVDRLETKRCGLMQTCQCCYDDEVMPKHTFNCPNGCKFCRDCIQKSCEIAFGEGKTVFPCLADCSAEFTLQTLQNVLPPKMFSKLAQKKALVEIKAAVKAAGIEELETCPFCDFASIPNEGDKIFRCLNPDCMKESCRSCKEQNHVPLKCQEVEKDEHVKARIHIENAMTQALIRNCWKCGTSFFKEEGCNKMTCSCGAQMCYICQQPVKDYSHFNGIGGDKFDLCPLYSDTNLVNQQNVMGAAEAAKAQIDPAHLKVDPTVDVVNHYTKRRKELPREPHMDVINVNRNQGNGFGNGFLVWQIHDDGPGVNENPRAVIYPEQILLAVPNNPDIHNNQGVLGRLYENLRLRDEAMPDIPPLPILPFARDPPRNLDGVDLDNYPVPELGVPYPNDPVQIINPAPDLQGAHNNPAQDLEGEHNNPGTNTRAVQDNADPNSGAEKNNPALDRDTDHTQRRTRRRDEAFAKHVQRHKNLKSDE